jgi:hypothetical protein
MYSCFKVVIVPRTGPAAASCTRPCFFCCALRARSAPDAHAGRRRCKKLNQGWNPTGRHDRDLVLGFIHSSSGRLHAYPYVARSCTAINGDAKGDERAPPADATVTPFSIVFVFYISRHSSSGCPAHSKSIERCSAAGQRNRDPVLDIRAYVEQCARRLQHADRRRREAR